MFQYLVIGLQPTRIMTDWRLTTMGMCVLRGRGAKIACLSLKGINALAFFHGIPQANMAATRSRSGKNKSKTTKTFSNGATEMILDFPEGACVLTCRFLGLLLTY